MYCDGTNGTPDLRGRALIGTGSWIDIYGSTTYNLGDIGGERMHQLTINEMPSHNHVSPYAQNSPNEASTPFGWDLSFGFNKVLGANDSDNNNTRLLTSNRGGNQSHNIMQPYMAVHWIMKL